MGASQSWLVCKANSFGEIKDLLCAKDLEENQKPSFGVTISPSNHLFIFESRWREWTFTSERERRKLSLGREVYFCMLEEHVMASEAAFWKDGKEIWQIQHSSEEGVYNLETRGQLPLSFEKHKHKRFQEQDSEGGEDSDGDCIISIPLDVATELSGYDGELNDPEGDYFEWSSNSGSSEGPLKVFPSALRSWLGKIFGKILHG